MAMMMMKTVTMQRRASSAAIVSIARSHGAAASLGTPAPAGCTTLASFLSAFPNHKPHLAFYSAISSKFKSSSEKALKFQPELRNDINNVNSLDDALSLFERMVRMRPLPSVIQFNQLLTCIVKMKNHYSSVISLFRDMSAKGIPIDDYTLTLVINCYCVVGRVDLAFSTLSGFFKRGFVPNVVTFGTLLKGLFREHKVPEAQELFKKIIKEKLCKPNETMLGIVIDGLCKAGNTQTAIEFLRAMEKRGSPCKPTAIIYNTVIDSLCKDKMVDEALALLQEMIEKDIPPNVVTYNCLIHGLCNLSRWKDVDKLFAEMKVHNIVPDVFTFNIVVDALCKEGHIEDAEEVVHIMVQQGQNPDLVTYSSLMDGYCLQRRIDDASRVFNTMVASGLHPISMAMVF
nr:putative pentatricopeptide repeat-containing protein At1g12700, mitochondrial [Coffea arabica]XP_027076765.1 putative pentatricopeptide repeat-containing protein At1g12700, mitochondrial [Coffea arabica]XP_027076766.1 putative pentatricopeptide repeat-containing protein At1g12700, mitochondrial [Coffea arabica]XP_027076767.1 putative pentatricopeptide repeat-containing protein At1g12700, mitochondrial [Coffea arabica]XP_027076768.1 putative pentatricopeptide repeat-containing protein At1g127